MTNTLPLTAADLCIAVALMLVPALITLVLQLGLFKKMALASLRTVIQLAGLALVLDWVFALERPSIVLAVLASMVINASIAAVRRTDQRFPGIWWTGLLAVSISASLTTSIVAELIIGVDPWYQPRYLIPLLGMVLGNTLTGISLALDRFMANVRDHRHAIEDWLALGATHREALRSYVADAIRVGMIPILNSMAVVGIVSLPGMMTGQILAGESPARAVQYQIVVMFMVASATSIGTTLAVLAAFRQLVTRDHQLAHHRLSDPRAG